MHAPTVQELLAAFRDLDEHNARLIVTLADSVDDPDTLAELIDAECTATHEYRRRCYHDPIRSRMWRRTLALHAIDRALSTYGVEALDPPGGSHPNGPPFEYCNAGDTYATTLIYDRDRDALIIGCWGDIVESDPRFQESHE